MVNSDLRGKSFEKMGKTRKKYMHLNGMVMNERYGMVYKKLIYKMCDCIEFCTFHTHVLYTICKYNIVAYNERQNTEYFSFINTIQ